MNSVFEQITNLANEIREGNASRGFEGSTRPVGTSLMLITSELAEALEADRKGKHLSKDDAFGPYAKSRIDTETDTQSFKNLFESFVKDSYEDELSDAFIRLLDEAAARKIDIGWHVQQKLKYNATREFKHGKKY